VTANDTLVPIYQADAMEIRGQLPYSSAGRTRLVARTPSGQSQPLEIDVSAGAPAIFRTGRAGPLTGLATVYRAFNNDLVTDSNPVHPGDELIVYLTGLGRVTPEVRDGTPAGADPLATAAVRPTLTLGAFSLDVQFAGLVPREVGVYQINATVPDNIPEGDDVPLRISAGGRNTEILVRVLR
jgi:uncharacterized protein (TIGR03437 family)